MFYLDQRLSSAFECIHILSQSKERENVGNERGEGSERTRDIPQEREREQRERIERERMIEWERIEREKVERERMERERLQKEKAIREREEREMFQRALKERETHTTQIQSPHTQTDKQTERPKISKEKSPLTSVAFGMQTNKLTSPPPHPDILFHQIGQKFDISPHSHPLWLGSEEERKRVWEREGGSENGVSGEEDLSLSLDSFLSLAMDETFSAHSLTHSLPKATPLFGRTQTGGERGKEMGK